MIHRWCASWGFYLWRKFPSAFGLVFKSLIAPRHNQIFFNHFFLRLWHSEVKSRKLTVMLYVLKIHARVVKKVLSLRALMKSKACQPLSAELSVTLWVCVDCLPYLLSAQFTSSIPVSSSELAKQLRSSRGHKNIIRK